LVFNSNKLVMKFFNTPGDPTRLSVGGAEEDSGTAENAAWVAARALHIPVVVLRQEGLLWCWIIEWWKWGWLSGRQYPYQLLGAS
jgi:hypothetical protein